MAIAIEHVIAASSIKGVGRQFLLRCIDDCSDASEINYENFVAFVAPEKHKRICRGAGSCNPQIEMKELKKAYDHTLKLLERSADEKIFYIGSNSSKYPRRLRRCKDHPLFLFYRGNLEICDTMRCAAVIGTRQPSADALKAEKKICDYLTEYGWNIVSGLAFGCDETAHRTAVEYWKNTGKGTTTAILADGLDAGSIYPKENAELADEIVDCGGLLLSEYIIGTSCRPYYLTERDKWQAQLSDIVIPVQTGVAGGTFHALTRAAELDIPSFIPYLREYDSPDCEQSDLCRKGMMKAVKKYKCLPFRTVLELDRMLKLRCSA